MKFSIKETADSFTFTEEILNGKLYFFVQWMLTTRNTRLLRITLLMFFHKLAPKKTKNLRSNQKPNVSKTLSLAIMTRSRLEN